MTTISIDLMELLDDRYDLELKDYWTLSDEDKDNLSLTVIRSLFTTLKLHPETFIFYITLIENKVKIAEMNDEYEQAEIFNRIKIELENILSKS